MGARMMVGAPLVSGALAVYPIGRDEDQADEPRIMTLPEALDAGVAVVRELGKVEELAVEVLGNLPVLGLVGDLMRGGRQDRVLRHNVVAMPGTHVRVGSFCVEAGRWERRGTESDERFGGSTRAAPSSMRCLLARGTHQQAVWDHVRDTQRDLSRMSTAGASIMSRSSRTSLQLSLEHADLGHDLAELVAPLRGLPDVDVVGHVVFIGGRLCHADLFSSAELHARLWPRLLDAAAVDALGMPASSVVPDPDEVVRWLDEAFALPAASASPGGAAWVTRRRSERLVCVETHWGDQVAPLHALVVAV